MITLGVLAGVVACWIAFAVWYGPLDEGFPPPRVRADVQRAYSQSGR